MLFSTVPNNYQSYKLFVNDKYCLIEPFSKYIILNGVSTNWTKALISKTIFFPSIKAAESWQ